MLVDESNSTGDAVFLAWHRRWTERLARQAQTAEEVVRFMDTHNPAVIPRNHVVEIALTAATTENDLASLQNLLASLATPYDEVDQPEALLNPPPRGTPRSRTLCGT